MNLYTGTEAQRTSAGRKSNCLYFPAEVVNSSPAEYSSSVT